ncbi:MAG: ABC transporter ATP-binding protein [Firmicutes bacterium]|nr:ABC transporter ATP-binding protein [Bacillota bacterium]
MASIVVSDLRKAYGAVKALDGISFQVEAGEVFGMLGPNGAGKTTTVEILVGLRERDGGHVSVLGFDPARNPQEVKDRIGVQLQTSSLFPHLTVREILVLFSSFYRHKAAADSVDSLIARVGLQEKAKTQTRHLSGGQLQRLGLATALVNGGEAIFLDEPTTGLDPQARRTLWDIILDQKRQGKTVFLTTHYMDEAERLCDRVAVVDHGKIIALGSPSRLIAEHFQERALEFSEPRLAHDEHLASLPGVGRVQFEDGHITLYTQDVPQSLASLMEYANQAGAPIADLTVRSATLEDVFLKLTGRRIRE